MVGDCDPCSGGLADVIDPAAPMPTCAQMMAEAVAVYNALRRGMLTGQRAVEVEFGEQRVRYADPKQASEMILDEIRRLHSSCPNEASTAILGLGDAGLRAGSLCVRFGSESRY